MIHRGIGVHQQFLGGFTIARIHRNAVAGGYLQVMFGDAERARNQADLARGQIQRVILLGQLHQQDELVTADSRQGVLTAQIHPQALGDFPQQLIAHMVTECIIDRFKTVQIDEHQRKTAALFAHHQHRLVDAIGEQHPVRQPGQWIMQGQLGQFSIGLGQ